MPNDANGRRNVLKLMGVAVASAGLWKGLPAASGILSGDGARPGDFDFLTGDWEIQHRRLKAEGSAEWDEFRGEASCWSILGGRASIEELRIPARDFSGMGLRLLDPAQNVWHDFWVNGKQGILTTPGQTGTFRDGVGTFEATEEFEGRPLRIRGVWDMITASTCRWSQATSRDEGMTWQENWIMDWKRKQ